MAKPGGVEGNCVEETETGKKQQCPSVAQPSDTNSIQTGRYMSVSQLRPPPKKPERINKVSEKSETSDVSCSNSAEIKSDSSKPGKSARNKSETVETSTVGKVVCTDESLDEPVVDSGTDDS